ncbi:MAG: zinc-binding alcohol dehydrogenase [Ahrensia sp.]
MTNALALWITDAQTAQIQPVAYNVGDADVEIETLFSGISRGTERLVFEGRVPVDEHETMRAPFQEGTFSFPVKYGYAAVGRVLNGDRKGTMAFALFPHQSQFSVPAHMAFPVTEAVPAERAILAANMETAVNIIWDANVSVGDRVVVIGCGVVGALSAYLAAHIPGTQVTIVDIDPTRETLATRLGCDFATPDTIAGEADVVIHATANQAGLALAISLAGVEATIVEASWYGAAETTVPLGGKFHHRRQKLISSQVGRIPARQAARWTFARRLTKALSLLVDPALDALISGETAFHEIPLHYDAILRSPDTLCHRIRYES